MTLERSPALALNATGVRWALLRPASSDIDVLMDAVDLPRAAAALQDAGFARLPAGQNLSHHHFLAHHPVEGWIWLDVQTSLGFGPGRACRLLDERACLDRRVRAGEVYTLAPPDGFWALLLHCLLNRPSIVPRHRAHIQSLMAGGPVAVPAPPQRTFPAREANLLVDLVGEGRWEEIERLRPRLLAALPATRQRFRSPLSRVRSGWEWRGLTVALLGPDGAGKSTLAAGIARSFPFPVHQMYGGLHTPRLTRARRLPPGLSGAATAAILTGRRSVAAYHSGRGRLVIFDRYEYDALLWQGYGRPAGVPAPDITLILHAPAGDMYERKGGRKHTIDELESARRAYLRLADTLPHAHVLDASLPATEVLAQALSVITQAYGARWRRT